MHFEIVGREEYDRLLSPSRGAIVVGAHLGSFDALRVDRSERPFSEAKLYRSIVLDDLLREREEILSRLRRRGLHTLDLVSETVTASVLNRYLALRYAEA